jgi:hypothetical protein
MKKYQAYHDNADFREQVLAEIKRHEKLDMFREGIYGEGEENDFKGCAIGCTVNSLNLIQKKNFPYSSHKSVAEALDVPVELCYLIDKIFENLPAERRKKFTYRVWSSIQAGADTSDVPRKMKIWILQRTLIACEDIKYEKIADVKAVIQDVVDALEGVGDLKTAYAAARAAAGADTTWAVAWAAAANAAAANAANAANAASAAASAAADAAARTAADAAACAAYAVAYRSEQTAFWIDLENELVRLLKETKGQ